MKKPSRRKTATSSFGTSGRISHDSSRFYNTRLYPVSADAVAGPAEEQPPRGDVLDRVFRKSSERMDELPDNSVHLMITSPPYNVSKEYDEDLTLDEYRDLLRRVLKETHRALVDGGRACINVANIGRKPYIPIHAFLAEDVIALGYSMRGEIIWNKGGSAGPSTAWGSWKSATNPTLRDVHEYILIFSKNSYARNGTGKKSTIERDEFLEYTKSIWTFPSESARRVGHPAPFPIELPRRLIQLYSFEGDIVLDPFAGSGSTCIAALQAKRHFVAYEKSARYAKLAEKRMRDLSLMGKKKSSKLDD
ncbi:MAG: site-specific DNA-methyltransferase [Ignavibacteriales bacterium]|nr:site-specific DNA-methyltransferase [Ignavibacteriales bacterium]